MYNTKYECRYHKNDIILPEEKVSPDEEAFIRNTLYKEDFLNIFSIKQVYNDNFDTEYIDDLYEKIEDCDEIQGFMLRVATKLLISDDLKVGLCLLYSYDYMYLMHECVSQYLDTGSVSLESIERMDKILG